MMRGMPLHHRCLALCIGIIAGCAFEPIELEGRRCPCASDWTCGPDAVCVRNGSADLGADLGVDGGTGDGGERDAAVRDAASTDATLADASLDAGSELDASTADGGRCFEDIIPVAVAADNGHYYGNDWTSGGAGLVLECGAEATVDGGPAARARYCYARFRLPRTIPPVTTRFEVLLVLRSAGSSSWELDARRALEIGIEDAASAMAPSLSTRPPRSPGGVAVMPAIRWPDTGALVWGPPFPSTDETSPNLGPVLRTSDVSLVSGNYVQLWIKGAFDDDNGYVYASAFGGEAAPRLIVRWCE